MMPDFIKVILVVVVGSLLLLACVGLPAYFIAQTIPQATVRGMKFFFLPRKWLFFRPTWANGFQPAYVARFIDLYSTQMPAVFASIGISVTENQLRDHFAQVKCIFRPDYLRSLVREATGLMDANNDGKTDKLVGLTDTPDMIEVAVVEERKMMLSGVMRIERTAFTYEAHNTAIERFAGKGVALAESFVADNDPRLEPYLQGGHLVELKQRRRTLDAAFQTIKAD